MPQTRVYRILLVALNIAALALGSIDVWGPGIGITLAQIGAIVTLGNLVIVGGRQLLDGTTATLPSKGPLVFPASSPFVIMPPTTLPPSSVTVGDIPPAHVFGGEQFTPTQDGTYVEWAPSTPAPSITNIPPSDAPPRP